MPIERSSTRLYGRAGNTVRLLAGMDMAETKVVNIVSSTFMGVTLDLHEISDRFAEAEYKKKPRFPGLIYRMKKPKVAILLFSSGKLVCTGANTMDQSKEAVNILRDRLTTLFAEKHPEELEKIPKELNVKIQNIVAMGDLDTIINLNKVAVRFSFEKVEYEPEQFPGLVYRIDEPRIVFLLFGSGKVVCTGGKNIEDIDIAMDILIDELKDTGFL